MNGPETVELLTDIIARQSIIIRDLYGVVCQLDATTSLAPAVTAIQAETDEVIAQLQTH